MKKVKQLLRSTSIKKRLLIGFILVPILVLSVFFITYDVVTKQVILEKSQQNSEQLLTIVTENFNLNVNKFEQQLDEIMSNPYVHTSIDEEASLDYVAKRELYMNLNDFINTKTHFLSNAYELAVYTTDEALTFSKGYRNFSDDTIAKYAPLAKAKNGQSVWFHTTMGSDDVVGLARALYDADTKALKGYVFLALQESAFTSMFAREDVKDDAIIVVDNENRYLFGQFEMSKGEVVYANGVDRLNIETQTYMINSKEIQDIPWKIVNLVDESYALKELWSLRSSFLLYVLMILALLFGIMTIIYRSFYDPLHNILLSMKRLSQEQLDTRIHDQGNDEIHELAENFDEMSMHISNLVKEVEMEQSAKREAEIKMLQAQINPHFLFNTLNTLRYLAIMNEDKPLSQGIAALAKLLRNTITDKQELVEITEEIENIRNYIIIQKLRYGDLFETQIHVEPELEHMKIMKFLLQPIVENAILHGFEEDGTNQLLKIDVCEEENGLYVAISDNGKGFQKTTEEDEVKHKRLSGIGMKNIEERIALTYGEAYHMEIESSLGKGTCVRLHLPKIEI